MQNYATKQISKQATRKCETLGIEPASNLYCFLTKLMIKCVASVFSSGWSMNQKIMYA